MIQDGNVLLRPFEEKDVEIFYDWINRPESMGDYSDFCMVPKSNIHKSICDGYYWNETRKYFVIEADKFPIGEVVVHKALNYPSAGVELAICIDEKEYLKKRYGARIINLLLDYIFMNESSINRIQAVMDIENIPAIKLFERCNFKKEGILRGISFHHGTFHDSHMYSILRKEWGKFKGL